MLEASILIFCLVIVIIAFVLTIRYRQRLKKVIARLDILLESESDLRESEYKYLKEHQEKAGDAKLGAVLGLWILLLVTGALIGYGISYDIINLEIPKIIWIAD